MTGTPGRSLAEAIRVLGQELIGEDPRRIDLIGRRLLGRGQGRRPGADEGPRRDRDRALRHQGQVAGRAGLRAAGRAVPRPVAALLVALRLVPGDRSGSARGRAGADDGQLDRARRRRRGGRVQGTQDEPAGAGPDDRPAAHAVRGDRPLPDRRRRGVHRGAARAGRTGHGDPVRRRPGVPPRRDHRARAGARAVRPVLAGGGRVRCRRTADRPTRHADAAVPRRGADPPRAVPAVPRAARHRRGDGRGADERPVRVPPDLRAGRPLRHDGLAAQLHEPARHARQRPPVRGDAQLRDLRDRHGRRALEVGPDRPEARDRRRRADRAGPAGPRGEHRRGGSSRSTR